MHDLVLGDLKIAVDESQAGRLVYRWEGMSNSRDPSAALRPFLEVALAEAGTRKATLEMHFEKLSHFNSSTMVVVLRFIDDARKRKVKLSLHYDATLRWQSHSFEAIAFLRTEGEVEVHAMGEGVAKERIVSA